MNPQKNGGIELAFTRAKELSNENGLLDFQDRKQVAGIILHSLADLENKSVAIREILQEAFILDESILQPVNGQK